MLLVGVGGRVGKGKARGLTVLFWQSPFLRHQLNPTKCLKYLTIADYHSS